MIPEPSTPSIVSLIDHRHETMEHEKPRSYMGISSIGHECDRWLWLQFHWAVFENFPGRMYRLFARGQREEAIMAAELKAVGIILHNTGEDQSEVDFGCFVKGHLDGIIESGIPEAPKSPHVWECKTHNKKSFEELLKLGVKEAKPLHWAQMQCYMLGKHIDRALYTAICKDDDRIYTERVRVEPERALALIKRGQSIAVEQRLPAPLSVRPEWYKCKLCPGWDFCHGSKCTKNVNCRTCTHFTAHNDERCTCALYDEMEIPLEMQRKGCKNHVLHPDMVSWALDRGLSTQDAAAYRLPDGKVYLNGYGGFSSTELLKMSEANHAKS